MSNNTLSENILCGDSNQTEINQFEISQSASVCTDNVLILDCDLNIMDLSKKLNNADIVLSSSNNQIVQEYDVIDNILMPVKSCNTYNDNDFTEIEDINWSKSVNHSPDMHTAQEINNNLEQANEVLSNKNYPDCNSSESSIINNCDSDDATNDPDYCHNETSESFEEENNIPEQSCSKTSNNSTRDSLQTSLNVSGQAVCNNTDLRGKSSKSEGAGKKIFYYCKKLQSKIGRHLETVHKNEEEVKKFAILPKGNKERQKIIGLFRRKGAYLYNTDPTYNKGKLIVCRRPTESKKRTARDFICCGGCKGSFTKNNIRHHFKECTQKAIGRSVKILGRKVEGRIHQCANSILRNVVFPVLKEDDIIRLIRYDELLIIYGNKLCVKYKHQHQQDMIRARLRLLGRFLQALKTINKKVTDFFSIYHPSIYDDCITAVNQVAGLNISTKVYAVPSVASRLGTLIKQIRNLAIAECIKRNTFEKEQDIENYLKLLQEDFHVSVNKTVEESILQAKRHQLQDLPSLEDIKLLHSFLQLNRRKAFNQLSEIFTFNTWRQLAQFTLISVQVFNRRRAGEIERITVDDYKHQEGINEQTNPDLYKSLSHEARSVANKYVRFVIRGKLGRSVPVLLDDEMKCCVDLILRYRKEANIPQGNPYVFALPGYDKKRFKYLRACDLLRTYSLDCGAKMPLRLRGTKLRKHIATKCITLNLSDPDITQLANYLGHERSIHMQHYRQSIPQLEIVKISRLLKIAQGETDDTGEDVPDNEYETDVVMNKTCEADNRIDNDNSDVDSNSSSAGAICNATNKKRKRSTSPYGPTKRIRWTQEECDVITNGFKHLMKAGRKPTGKQMVEIKMKNKCLSRRSIPQIRSWIHNEISKKYKPVKNPDSTDETHEYTV
ncbi:uncharacterized protein LOC143894360 [Temnothorax americanus]|uniref:uncharacterized protein LOC143894360 n=1 Tax=Temnothorax americanus TaxID=1964332 RepID=UPI00406761F3